MSPALPGLHRASAAAAFATILLLQTAPAQADEVIVRNCLHDFRTAHAYDYSNDQGSDYGSDRGGSYSDARSFTVPSRSGSGFDFRRGTAHRRLIARATDANGGVEGGGSNADHGDGYDHSYATGNGGGSESGNNLDSCVEVRRQLTNPYVIQVQPPQSDEAIRAADEHDRLWREHCHPDVKQDAHGIRRYVYSASGCEYGKYE